MSLFLFCRNSFISIHAPAKGATQEKPDIAVAFIFQSTLPRRERQYLRGRDWTISYFNPRSREGSDIEGPQALLEEPISIHAPAKGATLYLIRTTASVLISIHAPAKGATLAAVLVYKTGEISIHAPAKGATPDSEFSEQRNTISIHAPAKGATEGRCYKIIAPANFNPRSREGSDTGDPNFIAVSTAFQSTLPRRERPASWTSGILLYHFNPRSREGSD